MCIGREGGGGIAQHGQSLISTIALLMLSMYFEIIVNISHSKLMCGH